MATITPTDPGIGNEAFTAINNAYASANDGDVIDVTSWPVGDRLFSGVVNTTKLVSFKGPGIGLVFKRSEATPDDTIWDNNALTGWHYMIRYNINSDKPCGIDFSGITLKSKIPSVNDGSDGLSMTADRGLGFLNAVDFRVFNCRFENFGDGGLEIRHKDYLARGVVYNCQFYHNYKGALGLGLGYGVTVYGEGNNWYPNMGNNHGTSAFIFIEDCSFDYHRHSVATAGNSIHVVRYNTFAHNIVAQSHCLDTHDSRGPGNGTNSYGSRVWEIYNNTIINTTFLDGTPIANGANISTIQERAIGALSGDGVIHDNVCSGYRFMIGYRQTQSTSDNYPYIQQGGWMSGRRKGSANTASDPIAADGDFWEWNNTFTPYISSPVVSSQKNFDQYDYKAPGTSNPYYLQNRDWHSAAKPGYVPYAYPHPDRLRV